MTRNLQGVGIFLLIGAAFFSYEIFVDEKIVLPSILDFSFKPSFLVDIDVDYEDLYKEDDEIIDGVHTVNTFDSNGTDTMVFLHIQKTGGTTLGTRLVNHIEHHKCIKVPETKRWQCLRPLANAPRTPEPKQMNVPHTWLFSRYSTGWLCGLHADWTELQGCVENKLNEIAGEKERNLLYITNLRNATMRFISEWKHVQRGATWSGSTLTCGGNQHTNLTTQCLPEAAEDWMNVTLAEFTACNHNLALNRQTRMIADLTKIECYKHLGNLTHVPHDIERKMLESAKENLVKMRWFGLIEYQLASKELFEYSFQPLRFDIEFEKWDDTHSSAAIQDIPQKLIDEITRLNHLDAELYAFARELFFQRYRKMKETLNGSSSSGSSKLEKIEGAN